MAETQNRREFLRNHNFQIREIFSYFLLVSGGGLLSHALFKPLPIPGGYLGIFGGILIVVAILLISHRITRPMFRFELTLDQMKQGHLHTTLKLRDTDEGKELAQKINEFNCQLSKSFRTINQNSKALTILIDQVSTFDLPEGEKEQLASHCWSMQEHNRKITNNSIFFVNQKASRDDNSGRTIGR